MNLNDTARTDTELLRQKVIEQISQLADKASNQSYDPFYTSSSGYNLASWASRAYAGAIWLVENSPTELQESSNAYAQRLLAKLEIERQRYLLDPDDEDGGALGAIRDAMMTIRKVFAVS